MHRQKTRCDQYQSTPPLTRPLWLLMCIYLVHHHPRAPTYPQPSTPARHSLTDSHRYTGCNASIHSYKTLTINFVHLFYFSLHHNSRHDDPMHFFPTVLSYEMRHCHLRTSVFVPDQNELARFKLTTLLVGLATLSVMRYFVIY